MITQLMYQRTANSVKNTRDTGLSQDTDFKSTSKKDGKMAKKKKSGRGTWITHKKRCQIYDRDNWTCQYCGCRIDRHNHSLDHITPWSVVRNNSACNLVTACIDCNVDKSDIILELKDVPLSTKRELRSSDFLGFSPKMTRKEQYTVLAGFLDVSGMFYCQA